MAGQIEANERLRHLTIPSSHVKRTGTELGIGAYGKVCEVDYSGKLCAAKEIHSLLLQLASREESAKLKDDFFRECHLWSMLRHPNVVQFLGIYYPSTDQSGLPVMLLEKMQDSVRSLIEKYDNVPLLVKLSILHDVSLGLRYLHDQHPPIVHRDLSPNNILVSAHLEAKITDLGVAKVMMTGSSKTLTKTPGTAVFMPPEALDDKPLYGPPLDVFSYGGVILHMATGQWPVPKSWSQIDPRTGKRILLSEVERRQQYIDLMSGSTADLKPLAVSCLEDDPKLRPLAADISEKIKMLKEVCSNRSGHDGMDPFSWLADIKHLSISRGKRTEGTFEVATAPDLFSGPVKIHWQEGAPAPGFIATCPAVVFDGSVYVGAGDDEGLFRVDVYHPDTNKWGDPISTPYQLFAMSVLKNKLIIVGGCTDKVECTNKLFVLESGQWKYYSEMPTARCLPSAVSHHLMLVVVGGCILPTKPSDSDGDSSDSDSDDDLCGLATTELLDSATGQWFKCDNLPKPFNFVSSAIVGNTLYALAMERDIKLTSVYSAALDALSSHQLKWQQLLDIQCKGLAAVSLNNKYLLAIGGEELDDSVRVLKEGDGSLKASTMQSIGALPTVQCTPSAVSLGNRVIVIGGADADDINICKTVTIGTF